jgi:uncharacterized protein YecE (DUF72 family)
MIQTRGTPGIFIGTSGWSYEHWKGNFYPAGLPAGEMLSSYVQHFNTAEINNSFYHLPSEQAVAHWKTSVPDDFVFSAKASRFITHMKKLKDPADTLPPFMERIRLLGPRLGPILFQLPPGWHLNLERLTAFLQSLDKRYRYTFECRDPSWFDDRVYEALAKHQAAWCIWDLNRQLSPLEVTADFVYIRLHGPDGPYCGCYDTHALTAWAERVTGWQAQGRQVYCYFDNDEAGYAPRNALALKRLLESPGS